MNKQSISTSYNVNNQSKIIIMFWILSSILIFFTAFFIIDRTEKKISDSYHHFALTLTQAVANETVEILSNDNDKDKKNKFTQYSLNLIKDNNDIEFIDYKNNDASVYYVFGDKPNKHNKNAFIINTPIYDEGILIGTIDVGFTGKSITSIEKATKISIVIIFSVMWLLSLIAVLINTFIVTRQIALLSYGVRKISSGEFGYKLQQNELWGEIKQLFDEFNKMSVKLRQYEEKNIDELTYEKNKLESVLMSIANGVIVCDSNDNVILMNNAGASLLNVSTDFIGENINSYSDEEGNLPFKEHIKQFKNTPLDEMKDEPLAFQLEINGIIMKALMSPIFTLNDEYLGYIAVLHDITKEAEVDKLKSTFISNVSHELRTPVTVLRSYIDTLCNYGDDFDEMTKQEFLQIMNQEAQRLNNMINDILDFSRLESNNVVVERDFLNIQPIIENTVTSMQILALEKNLKFEVSIEQNLPKLYINQDSIERVMKNLLSNAVKYSNTDSKIIVTAKKDGNNVVCSVEDFGIGIKKEHLSKIFDRFYRVENKTHTVKGTGLGLHLAKISIEQQNDGTMFVHSEPNKGSIFGFMLPIIGENEITDKKDSNATLKIKSS